MTSLNNRELIQLQQFFERSVDNFANNNALVCDNKFFSYQELENQANQLANYMLSQGLTKNEVIGILLERSVDNYIAILATLKIGAAYVPIEVEYPDERINYIFSDMPFQAVLTSSTQQARKGLNLPSEIVIDKVRDLISEQSTSRPVLDLRANDAENLCYVIYTSGSTGKPKGVEITHRSICHYINVSSDIYKMTSEDKVYQGFSLAFDASLEEFWMAFANGAALIACTDKDTRSGVGLMEFLQQHQVSFFSTVPTLLSSLEGKLPHLRLLILGGEACTANLIKRWSRPGLKIMNTYGPTEATVIATYSECLPDKPVTIGKPLPGYEVLILNEDLQPVEDGKEGELCIGGRGLARGYVNQPDFTANKFVLNPHDNSQRLYRSGDLAMKTSSGDIQFLGRVDDQIKLRGFRIELNEIESVITEHAAINQAVVSLQELEQQVLVAYLIADKNTSFDLDQLKAFLHNRLPHYMIPSLFEQVEAFPLLASGKVNRKQLPKPTQTVKAKEYLAPSTALEKEITLAWEEALQQNPISVTADFFYDLGGHSLSAAKVVSSLRKTQKMQNLSILDIYKNPTIKQLALKFSKVEAYAKEPEAAEKRPKNTVPAWMYYLCGTGQALGCLLQYAISAWQLLAVILCYIWVTAKHPFLSAESATLFISLFFAMPIASLALTISAKWLLLGRVKPGQYRIWGWFYFRWWLVQRLEKNVFSARHLIASPLIILYYRLLGAKIGKNCFIGTVDIATHDVLEIGDNTSIGYDATILGYILEDGWLKIGKVTIGKNCFIGGRSVVNIDTVIEDNSALDHLSMLPMHEVIPRDQFYSGSPACHAIAPSNHVTKQKNKAQDTSLTKNVGFAVLHYLSLTFAMMVYYTCYIPGIMLISYFFDQSEYFTTILFAIPLGALIFLVLHYSSLILCKKIILNKIKPGFYALKSLSFLRMWTVIKMLDVDEINVMADSLYYPFFLRRLGAKIGKRVEMGEAPHIIPDMITIKEEGFAASSVAMGWPDVYNGYASFAPIVIGKRAFVGNVSFLPAGAELGDGGLLGCMTITPTNDRAAKPNTAWLGSPAVFLPKRELFTGFSDEQLFNPPKRLVCIRLAIEFIRILLPTTFSLILMFNMLYIIDYLLSSFSLLTTILVLPFMETVFTLAIVAVIIILKWAMLGKTKPTTKPIWDIFIWKNDVREYLYSYFINQHLTTLILGTPFIALLFNSMGAKIGKRVCTESAEFAEFDLITVGNDVCINVGTRIQTHLYEDRIFKLSSLLINEGCNIGAASTVLYNTVMEKNSSLGGLSLLMKGECLPENTSWRGIPAQSKAVYHYYEPEAVESSELARDKSVLVEMG